MAFELVADSSKGSPTRIRATSHCARKRNSGSRFLCVRDYVCVSSCHCLIFRLSETIVKKDTRRKEMQQFELLLKLFTLYVFRFPSKYGCGSCA